jgi:hypothetical protein
VGVAEILVKAVDATHSNPTKDTRGCYKRGDVIGVAPDGWAWGALETLPPAQGGKFVVIKITDVTRAQVVNWIKTNWATWADGPDLSSGELLGAAQAGLIVRRRRVKIDVDLLPAGVLSTLNTTGTYSTTWAAIRQYVRNKLTNATCTGVVV